MQKKNYKSIYAGIALVACLISFILNIKSILFISLIAVSTLIFFYSSKLISPTTAKLWCLSIGAATIMVFGDFFSLSNNTPMIVAALVWAIINGFGLYKATKL